MGSVSKGGCVSGVSVGGASGLVSGLSRTQRQVLLLFSSLLNLRKFPTADLRPRRWTVSGAFILRLTRESSTMIALI